MFVMLNWAPIARAYISSLITHVAAIVSCRFPLLPAQLYSGNIRAGHVKWAHFTPALFA